MPALAALITLAAAAQAQPPAPLFDAFGPVCAGVRNFDGLAQAALGAGWAQVSEADADPRIAAILAKGRDAVTREEPTSVTTGALFRRKVDGRDVYLATSRVTMKIDGANWFGNGCRAYDLDAPAAPSVQAATAWVGTAPTATSASGNAAKLSWEPWQDGVTLEITYVPRDNPLGAQYGIQGLVLVSQAMGGF
ncbi:hypothetical protein [Sphingomonas turrisvirgatae]|uniref:Uncharacterized protein n=1 Tax=Sphingomonas turrisvirgatae TaxID=1888892 RepID=A0A1E3LSK6_9SPHN|nr:hypothetical protein [Sphingomonas turrisvirgatae]ODP36752.1 hypothetical protein BFL28_19615 [Sphingomonas turrisvirgatae]